MSAFRKFLPWIGAGALVLVLAVVWLDRPRHPATDVSTASPELPALAESKRPLVSELPLQGALDDRDFPDRLRPEIGGAAAAAEVDSASPESVSDEERDRLLDEITAVYTSYESSALPRLEPYLRHPDPEIRAYALEAVVQVGDASGAALLRAAAKRATDPREAVALLDAADFLEIPPAPRVPAGSQPAAPGLLRPRARPAAAL